MRRSHPSVPARALHLHEGDRLQRLPSLFLRPLTRNHLSPFPALSLFRLRGHHLLGRGPGGRLFGLPLLLSGDRGLLLGRKLLCHVPLGSGVARDDRVHGGGCDPGVLSSLQRVLHQQGQNPSLLDMVPLPVAGEVPVRGSVAERVRRSLSEVLREGDSDVRQHAVGDGAGDAEGGAAEEHEQDAGHEHH